MKPGERAMWGMGLIMAFLAGAGLMWVGGQ